MFNNLKVGVRLGIGFAVTLVLLITVAGIGLTRLDALNQEIDNMVKDKFPKTVVANDAIDAINAVARHLRNAYIFSGAEQQRSLDAISAERKKITESIEKLEKTITSDKGKEKLKHVQAARAAYVTSQEKFLALLKENKRDEIVTLMQGDLRKAQAEYLKKPLNKPSQKTATN